MNLPFMPILYDGDACPAVFLPAVRASRDVRLGAASDQGVCAATRFIEAVQVNPDGAWAFVSKVYVGGFDLNALRELLPDTRLCQWVQKAGEAHTRGPFLTRSLYVNDPERDLRRLVHLRMVREPDRHGIWKICAIDQEDCPRGV